MKKYLTLLILVLLAWTRVGVCDDNTIEASSPAQAKEVPITNFKGLEGVQYANGALLIKSGFPFGGGMEFPTGFQINVGNSGDINKLKFDTILSQEQLSPDGKFVSKLANTGIGISWLFKDANTSFLVGDYVYTALHPGSLVLFTKEGVLLQGFKITPLSAFKSK